MSHRLPPRDSLARFSRTEWVRAIYVGLSNPQAQALVSAGLLEQRTVPRAPGQHGQAATEYRRSAPARAGATTK